MPPAAGSPLQWLDRAPIGRLQLAWAGRWEQALHLSPEPQAWARLTDWLARPGQDLAIEAFVDHGEGQAFAGLRLAALPIATQGALAQGLAQAFIAAEGRLRLPEAFGMLAQGLGLALFVAGPDFLELGQVNAWRSFGPVTFWRQGSPSGPREGLDEALTRHARYRAPTPRPCAIEFGYAGRFPHWVGLPVSHRAAQGHQLSPALARTWLDRMGEL